jgi:hypothetical protein
VREHVSTLGREYGLLIRENFTMNNEATGLVNISRNIQSFPSFWCDICEIGELAKVGMPSIVHLLRFK